MLVPDGIHFALYFHGADKEQWLVLKRLHDAGHLNLLPGSNQDRAVASQTEPSETRIYQTGRSCYHQVGTRNHSRNGFREHARHRTSNCDFFGAVVAEPPCSSRRVCRRLRLNWP